jgi:hypothetical protein
LGAGGVGFGVLQPPGLEVQQRQRVARRGRRTARLDSMEHHDLLAPHRDLFEPVVHLEGVDVQLPAVAVRVRAAGHQAGDASPARAVLTPAHELARLGDQRVLLGAASTHGVP